MSQDPYRYFRIEARELAAELGKVVLALEKEGPSPARVAHLLRLAHTLKGAARVVKQREIADRAHALEDALAPHRETGGPLPKSGIDLVLGLIDEIGERVAALDAAPAAPQATGASPAPAPGSAGASAGDPASAAGISATASAAPVQSVELRTVRADVSEVEELLDGMAEVQALIAQLGRGLEGVERVRRLAERVADELAAGTARPRPSGRQRGDERAGSLAQELVQTCRGVDRSICAAVEQLDRQARDVRQSAERMRLVSAAVLFTPLERAARDAAQAQGVVVQFAASGGELRLDAHLVEVVQPALVQMARNAVAHGIESPRERAAAGKPREGRIEVHVTRRGRRVAFSCRDDGRGVDFDAVRAIAQRKGLVAGDPRSLGTDALMKVLLAGGVSTSRTVDEVSGRGVGLDVVREAAQRLGGEVAVRSESGRGTTVEIEVPLSLAALEALQVEAAGAVLAIPLEAIRSTVYLDRDALSRSGRGEAIVHGGRVIPFLPLARVIGGPPRKGLLRSAVVVESASGTAAIGVDRLLGTISAVLRPLPELCPAVPAIAGASLDSDGNPCLVLDPDGLVNEALQASAEPAAAEAPTLPILVIDDSLTTRMLEQSILESAGFDVELATSAEEGLDRARRERFSLFLVDVEMPGMDGFSFIERTQADPVLRDTPAILVTSCCTPEHLRRGAEVGARGYIIKGEFNQGELLDRIRSLVG
jgi:two-component system, chemotaxis family, sensor kinase CheA